MSRKILVVDDSATARFQVVGILSEAGYETVEAENGDDALAKLEANPDVALVISDVNMPWKDGLELLAEIRQHPTYKALPVILLTTETNAAQVRQAKELGILGYLAKPLNGKALVATLKKVVAA